MPEVDISQDIQLNLILMEVRSFYLLLENEQWKSDFLRFSG